MCEQYRTGDLTRNQIAVFSSLEDMSDGKPDQLRSIAYRQEYVKQPHLRGQFGQYPPPDYELSIGFEINIDTGLPVPQNSQEYTRTYLENRDFKVTIRSTAASLAEHLHPKVALPIDHSVTTDNYEVIGEKYGMQEVSYLSSLILQNAGDYALRKNRSSDIFLDESNGDLRSFMVCQKVTEAAKVPHCEHVQVIQGFLAETRFKRSLINDFDMITQRSNEFVSCLFREQK